MVDCTFCGTSIPKGTGVMYVKKDAKIFRFCSRKCEKNMVVLGRKARNTTWTQEHRDAKAQAMAAQKAGKTKKKKTAKKAAKVEAKAETKKADANASKSTKSKKAAKSAKKSASKAN